MLFLNLSSYYFFYLLPDFWLKGKTRREFYAFIIDHISSEADCKLTKSFNQLSKNLIVTMEHTDTENPRHAGRPARLAPFLLA